MNLVIESASPELVLAALRSTLPNHRQKSKAGFVYAITDGQFVKIGKADKVETRIKQLQTGHPRELSILAAMEYPDAANAERIFHKSFKDFKAKIKGEWFEFPREVLNRLLSLIRNSDLPQDCEAIRWEGQIDPCPYCRGRSYQNGWCLDCGRKIPATKHTLALDAEQ